MSLNSHLCNCWHSGPHLPFSFRHPPLSPLTRWFSTLVLVRLAPSPHSLDVTLTTNLCRGGYIISAIFICAEYQRLGIHFRNKRMLRISFWVKLTFIIVEGKFLLVLESTIATTPGPQIQLDRIRQSYWRSMQANFGPLV